MAAYLVLLFAVLSRILPHAFGATSVGFTALGGGLLYFGARRNRWHILPAIAILMATDFYLTTRVYNYAFHASSYIVTWTWYAAVLLLGHQLLSRKATALRVVAAVAASSTSFFLLSNFAVWMDSIMYPHTAAGLATCYIAGIPFYANDAMSTAITAGALFGLPALARNIAESLSTAHDNHHPLA